MMINLCHLSQGKAIEMTLDYPCVHVLDYHWYCIRVFVVDIEVRIMDDDLINISWFKKNVHLFPQIIRSNFQQGHIQGKMFPINQIQSSIKCCHAATAW